MPKTSSILLDRIKARQAAAEKRHLNRQKTVVKPAKIPHKSVRNAPLVSVCNTPSVNELGIICVINPFSNAENGGLIFTQDTSNPAFDDFEGRATHAALKNVMYGDFTGDNNNMYEDFTRDSDPGSLNNSERDFITPIPADTQIDTPRNSTVFRREDTAFSLAIDKPPLLSAVDNTTPILG